MTPEQYIQSAINSLESAENQITEYRRAVKMISHLWMAVEEMEIAKDMLQDFYEEYSDDDTI